MDLCEVCGKVFTPTFNEKEQIEYDRVVVVRASGPLKYADKVFQ